MADTFQVELERVDGNCLDATQGSTVGVKVGSADGKVHYERAS